MQNRLNLIQAARAGDRHAYASLLEADAPVAYRVILAIVPEPADAQDVLQEAMVRAWRDLPKLRLATHWPGWFRRVAVHAAIDHVRAAARQSRAILRDSDADPRSNGVGSIEQRDEIQRALRQLPTDERALLALRFGADLEMSQVADVLGIPVGTAKSRLHRSLARLRVKLEADQ